MQKHKIVIFGNGSMAKVLHSYMKDEYEICGFCVDKCCIKSDKFLGLPLVPFENVEKYYPVDEYKMINSVGYIDMNDLRKKRSEEAKQKGYELISYIDKSVKIHEGVSIAQNCIIFEGISIHPNTNIQEGTFISANVSIGHDCNVGEYNWINSGVSIAGCVNIGKNCFWGVNSCSADNISIGDYNYIAANTLVNKSTKSDEVYISPVGEKFRLSSKNFLKFTETRTK